MGTISAIQQSYYVPSLVALDLLGVLTSLRTQREEGGKGSHGGLPDRFCLIDFFITCFHFAARVGCWLRYRWCYLD